MPLSDRGLTEWLLTGTADLGRTLVLMKSLPRSTHPEFPADDGHQRQPWESRETYQPQDRWRDIPILYRALCAQ
jgi:hypothetical protein